MTIKAYIVSAGDKWMFSFPEPPDMNEIWDGDTFHEDAARRHLNRNSDCITNSDSDDGVVYTVAFVFMDMVSQWRDSVKNETASADKKIVSRLDRKSDREMYTECSVIFRKVSKGIRFSVKWKNDDVPEQMNFERHLAVAFCGLAQNYHDECMEQHGYSTFFLDDQAKALAKEGFDMMDERDRKADIAESNARRLSCANYHNGFCSPCNFDCKHCKGGKCEELQC